MYDIAKGSKTAVVGGGCWYLLIQQEVKVDYDAAPAGVGVDAVHVILQAPAWHHGIYQATPNIPDKKNKKQQTRQAVRVLQKKKKHETSETLRILPVRTYYFRANTLMYDMSTSKVPSGLILL